MENQENPNSAAEQAGIVLAEVQIGAARAIAALIEALGQQPGIDRTKLAADFFKILPRPNQAGQMDGLLYQSIDNLLATNHAVPDRKQGE